VGNAQTEVGGRARERDYDVLTIGDHPQQKARAVAISYVCQRRVDGIVALAFGATINTCWPAHAAIISVGSPRLVGRE